MSSNESETDSLPATTTPVPTPAKNYGTIVLKFGKHKGKSLDDVFRQDPSYLSWLYKKMDEDKKKEPTKKLSPTMMAIRKYIKQTLVVA
jgi:hypothetical protein